MKLLAAVVSAHQAKPSPQTALAVEFAQQKAIMAQQDYVARDRMGAAKVNVPGHVEEVLAAAKSVGQGG